MIACVFSLCIFILVQVEQDDYYSYIEYYFAPAMGASNAGASTSVKVRSTVVNSDRVRVTYNGSCTAATTHPFPMHCLQYGIIGNPTWCNNNGHPNRCVIPLLVDVSTAHCPPSAYAPVTITLQVHGALQDHPVVKYTILKYICVADIVHII